MLKIRFIAKVRFSKDGCWDWKGAKTNRGYGAFNCDGRIACAHRVAYRQLVGTIPEGCHLHHTCENRACVNPLHLQPLDPKSHLRQHERQLSTVNAGKTHCKRGHALSGDNLRILPDGGRLCRECSRTRRKQYYRDTRGGVVQTPNGQRTHCPQGHEYSPANVYVTPAGRRQCRACKRNRMAGRKSS